METGEPGVVGFANSAYKVGRNEGSSEAGALSSSFHYDDNIGSSGQSGQGDESDSYSEDSEGPAPSLYSTTINQDR